MKVYYLTPTGNVPSILRKGLTAGKGKGLTEYLYQCPSGEHMREEKSTLYFVDDLEAMGELVSLLRNLVKGTRRFTILEVDLPEDYLVEPDERRFGGGAGALGGFLRSTVRRVPSSRIRVLGQVRIKSGGEPTYKLDTGVVDSLRLGIRSSELAGALEEPSSEGEEDQILEEIRGLPKSSRAHSIADEREERRDYWYRVKEQLERKEEV